jgi:hypothetical protein
MASATSDGTEEPVEALPPLLDAFLDSCDSFEAVPDCFSPPAHAVNTRVTASNNTVLRAWYPNEVVVAVCKFIASP